MKEVAQKTAPKIKKLLFLVIYLLASASTCQAMKKEEKIDFQFEEKEEDSQTTLTFFYPNPKTRSYEKVYFARMIYKKEQTKPITIKIPWNYATVNYFLTQNAPQKWSLGTEDKTDLITITQTETEKCTYSIPIKDQELQFVIETTIHFFEGQLNEID